MSGMDGTQNGLEMVLGVAFGEGSRPLVLVGEALGVGDGPRQLLVPGHHVAQLVAPVVEPVPS